MKAVAALLDRVPWTQGRFVRDSSILAVGLVAAQAITVGASPILTRYYSPDEFGALSAFSAIAGAISVIACLSFEPAIVLPATDEDAASVLVLCLIAVGAVSLLTLIGLLIWAKPLGLLLKIDGLGRWAWWIPLNLACAGTYQAFNYWSTRHRQFAGVAVTRVGQAGATAATQLAGSGASGLTSGAVVGQAFASALLVAYGGPAALRAWRARGKGCSTLGRIAREYHRFPLYSSWASFMNSGAFQVVPLVLTSAFGPAVAGWYFLGFRLATVPMSFIGAAAGQVILQRSAEQLARGDSLNGMVERVVGKSILFGAAPFVVLAVFAPSAFAAIFGEEWRMSGVLLRIMVPLFFVQFLTSPVSMILYSLQRQNLVAWVQAALFFGSLVSLLVGKHLFGSPAACLALYTVVQSSLYFVYLGLVVRCSSASPRMILREALTFR
ncbi:MAG: lipopolysaccharide biosynthesis protein [Vicinamibacterales bacterium]